MASTADLVGESVPDLAHGQKEDKSFKKMTMRERLRFIREVITVEPILCCYLMSSFVCAPALNTLELEKSCKSNEGYNDTVCEAITTATYADFNLTAENAKVQEWITKMHSWQQPLQSIMPILLVLFLGSYSDRHKIRKPFILIPILGEFLSVIGCILCVLFMREWPVEALGVAQTVIPSFFGGITMILMAVYSYIGDVSTLEMRTLRIGVVQIVVAVCTPIVQALSGVLFATIGYIGVLLVATIFYIIAIVYGYFCLKEPKRPPNVEEKNLCLDLFDPRNAIETFMVLVKKKKGNQRANIIIIMLILFVYDGVFLAEFSVFFLFTNIFYQLDAIQFNTFSTTNTVVHLLGTLIAVPLFTKVLRLHDLIILSVCLLDKIAFNVIIALMTTLKGLYLATVVSVITGVTGIALRSQASKVVSADDMGKAQSIFAIVESVAPAVFIPIYNQGIYDATKETYPQTFLFVGAALLLLEVVIVICLYVSEKRRMASKKKKAKEDNGIELDNGKSSKIVETTHM